MPLEKIKKRELKREAQAPRQEKSSLKVDDLLSYMDDDEKKREKNSYQIKRHSSILMCQDNMLARSSKGITGTYSALVRPILTDEVSQSSQELAAEREEVVTVQLG